MRIELDGQYAADTCRKILDFLNESTSDHYFFFDLKAERVYFSKSIGKNYPLMEHGREYVTPQEWIRMVYPQDLPMLREAYEKLRGGEQQVHRLEYRVINRRGDVVWISSRGKSQLDRQGRPAWVVGCISEAAAGSRADGLTGMLGMNQLKRESGALLDGERDGFLLLVGVDDLKSINLKRGREHGNAVLRRVAEVLEDAAADELCLRMSRPPFPDALPGVDPRIAARFYVGAMLSLLRWWLISPDPVPEEVLLDHLARFIPNH